MKINIKKLTCRRCGHQWYPRLPEVKMCAKCKTKYWDKEKKKSLRRNRLFWVWRGMVARCYDSKHMTYYYYGGRGIKICDEWRKDPAPFMEWAIKNNWKHGLQIDRKDNDGDYTPSNCRFVTKSVNGRNRRKARNKSSSYIGVCYIKHRKKYRSQITVNWNLTYIGHYETELEAITARDNYIINNKLEGFPLQVIER